MDISVVGIFSVLVINILVSAFCAGKLYQKVCDLSSEIGRLRDKFKNIDSHIDDLSKKVSRIEGLLEGKWSKL